MTEIEQIKLQNIIKSSAFNKQKYEVNIPIRRFINSIMDYINDEVEPTFENILKYGVPEFQRNNDKWSREMQIRFVENIIKGFVTKIQLFVLEENYRKNNFVGCQILDGLQRTTAISSFINGEFKLFNDTVGFEDIKDTFLRGINKTAILELYRFDTINDTIDFYVEMNENITHSPEDIQKALSFKV